MSAACGCEHEPVSTVDEESEEAERPWWRDRGVMVPVFSGIAFLAGLIFEWSGLEVPALVLFCRDNVNDVVNKVEVGRHVKFIVGQKGIITGKSLFGHHKFACFSLIPARPAADITYMDETPRKKRGEPLAISLPGAV